MIFFWFYLSGLSNKIIKKNLVTGDWSQSMFNSVTNHWAEERDAKSRRFVAFFFFFFVLFF